MSDSDSELEEDEEIAEELDDDDSSSESDERLEELLESMYLALISTDMMSASAILALFPTSQGSRLGGIDAPMHSHLPRVTTPPELTLVAPRLGRSGARSVRVQPRNLRAE